MDRFVQRFPKKVTTNENKTNSTKKVPKKKPDTKQERPSTYKVYERRFRENWKDLFHWLDEQNGDAFCVYCKKSLFNILTHIQRHEKSALHQKNVSSKKNQSTIEDSLMSDERRNFLQKVKHAENSLVMYCAVNNLPMSTMDSLPGVLKSIFPDSNIAKNMSCGRTKSTDIVKNYLAPKAKNKLANILRVTSFSLIVDESTDVSSKKVLALVARFYCKTKQKTCDMFFGLIQLKDCNAVSIFNAIKNHLDILEIPLQNVIGLATDNASVMSGEIGGLCAKFKKLNSSLFYMPCICHSLHLCASHACKKLPHEIEKLARDIYNFFAHSPKRIDQFQEFQDYVDVRNHKILRICDTRWLSLKQVVDRILTQWDALQLFFISSSAEDKLLMSKDIAEKISDPNYKIYFYFLSHILNIITKLNLDFQSEEFRLHKIYENFETNYKLILSFFIKRDICNKAQLSKINVNNQSNFVPLKDVYIGANAESYISQKNMDTADVLQIKSMIRSFYIELCLQITKRFKFESIALKSISSIDPEKITHENDFASFIKLLNEFPHLYDKERKEDICTQYKLLQLEKNVMYLENIEKFWGNVSNMKNAEKCPIYKDIFDFVSKVMSLPHSSAAAERIFSQLNMIKTNLKNKCSIETSEAIMFAKQIKNEYE